MNASELLVALGCYWVHMSKREIVGIKEINVHK